MEGGVGAGAVGVAVCVRGVQALNKRTMVKNKIGSLIRLEHTKSSRRIVDIFSLVKVWQMATFL